MDLSARRPSSPQQAEHRHCIRRIQIAKLPQFESHRRRPKASTKKCTPGTIRPVVRPFANLLHTKHLGGQGWACFLQFAPLREPNDEPCFPIVANLFHKLSLAKSATST